MIHLRSRKPPFPAVPLPPEPLEIDACYRYCEAMARARHHNFPVASLFVPAALRKHVFAIYAFARTADDIVDEPAFEGRRARELDRWEERLQACFHGDAPDHPVFVALMETVHRFDLPITPFSALVAGFRIDIDVHRYSTFVDLRNYTALAAEPIGDLLLRLGGYRDPALHSYAADLSTAVALATFWQHIGEDLERGRIYIPTEDVRHFQLTETDLVSRRPSPRLASLVRYEVARTRSLLARSQPLVDATGPELAIELALIWHGASRILDKIHRAGGGIMTRTPRLNALDKAEVVTRALKWRGGTLSRRIFR